MGLACVGRLAEHHAVVLADIDLGRGEELAGEMRERGLQVEAAHCDVTDPASVRALFEPISSLRALVHVVGLAPAFKDAERVMEVNLPGAARVAEEALPRMSEGGAAVFISSMASYAGTSDREMLRLLDDPLAGDLTAAIERRLGRKLTSRDAYRLSKQGLNRMCRRLSGPWGRRGARIMSLSPGLIRTPMGDKSYADSPGKYRSLERSPFQREGVLPEICDAVEFLISDRASFISGIDLLVDGGALGAREFEQSADEVDTPVDPRPA